MVWFDQPLYAFLYPDVFVVVLKLKGVTLIQKNLVNVVKTLLGSIDNFS